MTLLDETHDPALTSWVDSAQAPACDFPIQNLPYGVFRRRGTEAPFRTGVAIGDRILDIAAALDQGAFDRAEPLARSAAGTLRASTLNAFMRQGPLAWHALRLALSRLLRAPGGQACPDALVPMQEAELAVPMHIGGYTDFYTSIHHATAVGRQFRPEQPLLPNYEWVPIGYHGRTSSIGVSGQRFPRPVGQLRPASAGQAPTLAPCRRLDYELELGVIVGPGNEAGTPIPVAEAASHVFGFCLLNDWSARDIQAWEYQPLGPFLSKNFATTISPWIVTLEALAPYRCAWERPQAMPQPLPYLDAPGVRGSGALDLRLAVDLRTAAMAADRRPPETLAEANYRDAYWTFEQMVAHHTVGGCNLEPGDMLGTGTLSGPRPEQAGSLLELTDGGKRPLTLANGESRTFLEDGDSVTLRAWAERDGAARIGFGASTGTVLPARTRG